MRNAVVEGEPGIFPDPIARVLRAVGRFVTNWLGKAERPPQDPNAEEPPPDRVDP